MFKHGCILEAALVSLSSDMHVVTPRSQGVPLKQSTGSIFFYAKLTTYLSLEDD